MRNRTVAGTLAAVLVLLGTGIEAAPATAEPAATTSLRVAPPAAVAGGAVVVTGSCAQEPVPGSKPPESRWPASTDLSGPFEGGTRTVKLANGAFIAPGTVSAATPPGQYEVTTTCGGSAPFAVLAAPLLSVAPTAVVAGRRVTATGTCSLVHVRSRPTSPVELTLTGADGTAEPLAAVALDETTGVVEAATFPLPAGAAAGNYRVTSSCGGSADLTLLLPPVVATSPTPPPPPDRRVAVPNLIGLTEQGALRALGGDLQLAGPRNRGGTVVRQDPQPGSLVARGSAVTVAMVLAAPQPAASVFPLVPGLGLLALLATVLAAWARARHVRRRRREQRWAAEDVDTVIRSGTWVLPHGPGGATPSVDVRVEISRDPAPLVFEEAPHA